MDLPNLMPAGEREVLRCASCGLVQYRTSNNHCRKCTVAFDMLPTAPEASVIAEAEPVLTEYRVADTIRGLRKRQGLSQRALAQRMQVPRTYVSKIENGKAQPTLASLERIAAAMDTDVATLLRRSAVRPGPELMDDSFIRQIAPYLSRLKPSQLKRLLLSCESLVQHQQLASAH